MYHVTDLGGQFQPSQINEQGDIFGSFFNAPFEVVIRRANGTFVSGSPGIVQPTWPGISNKGFSLVALDNGTTLAPALFEFAANVVHPIQITGVALENISATGIDHNGNVVGFVKDPLHPFKVRSFLWDRSTQQTLFVDAAKVLRPELTGYIYLLGRNIRGHAVGYQAYYAGDSDTPFGEMPVYFDGTIVHELPPYGWTGSCRHITDQDVMSIGYNDGGVNGLYIPGKGFAPVAMSKYIYSLNDSATILWASTDDISFLTDAAGFNTPLMSLFPSTAGWSGCFGAAINDNGQITGFGSHKGEDHSFLLTPEKIPRPGFPRILPNIRTRPIINPRVWGMMNTPSRMVGAVPRPGFSGRQGDR